ncbi:MAG: hypothetical protein KIT84_39885 [Labilithrix sp.]|nr:hypothetical protein [Labilithrix sp.]MCW5817226.1 hypothetical protein [Labilithrix sp.]
MSAEAKRGMPWWGILLICFGAFVLVCAAGVGAVIWWVSSNKDRLAADGKKAMEEAQAFAAEHDQNECVDEGLRRADLCDGLMCETMARLFTKSCLTSASKSATLCDDVPKHGEIMATAEWLTAECKRRGRDGNQRCTRVLQSVPETCSGR